MTDISKEEIRSYLLSVSSPASAAIDEALFEDENFVTRIKAEEEELIQDYVNGQLDEDLIERFESIYLASEELIEKIEFAKQLHTRQHLLKEEAPGATDDTVGRNESASWFSLPKLAFLGLTAVLLLIVGFGVWSSFDSDNSAELAANYFEKIDRNSRLVSGRLAELPYKPFIKRRGVEKSSADSELAKTELTAASSELSRSRRLHLLGLAALAERKNEDAARLLVSAEKEAEKDDYRLFNDLSVAFLEIARNSEEESVKNRYLNAALERIEKTKTASPQKPAWYFNRALILTELGLVRGAIKSWEKFLELEKEESWRIEAEKKLQALKKKITKIPETSELLKEVEDLTRKGDVDALARLSANNRDLTSNRYLPIALVRKLFDTDEKSRLRLLEQLRAVGEAEFSKNSENLARDIAQVYVSIPANKDLKEGHDLYHQALSAIKAEQYDHSKRLLDAASLKLRAGGDEVIPSTVIALLNEFNSQRIDGFTRASSSASFGRLREYANTRGYLWVGGLAGLGEKSLAQEQDDLNIEDQIDELDYFVKLSKKISDPMFESRVLNAYLSKYSFLRDRELGDQYRFRLIKLTENPALKKSDKSRIIKNLTDFAIDTGSNELAAWLANEGLAIAKDEDSLLFEINFLLLKSQVGDSIATKLVPLDIFSDCVEKISTLDEGPVRSALESKLHFNKGLFFMRSGRVEEARNEFVKAKKGAEFLPPEYRFALEASELRSSFIDGTTRNDALIERVFSTLEGIRQNVSSERTSLQFFEAMQGLYDRAALLSIEGGENDKALSLIEQSRSALLARKQVGFIKSDSETGRLNALDNAQIRGLIDKDELVLRYSVLDNEIFVWIITKTETRFEKLEGDAENVKGFVAEFAASLKNPSTGKSYLETGNKLYRTLIPKSLNVASGIRRLTIIPDKFLFEVSFEALSDSDGQPLLKTTAIGYESSLRVMAFSRRLADQKSKGSKAVVVSNPVVDKEQFPLLDSLPESSKEAEVVISAFPEGKSLERDEATPGAFAAAARDANLIHLATHFEVDEFDPDESKIVFSPDENRKSSLRVRDLLNVRLDQARFVFLSACETSGERVFESEGELGLTRALQVLGVPTVIGTRWRIDSETTADFVSTFYRHLEKNPEIHDALRKTQIDFIRRENKESHPFYWAAFKLVGADQTIGQE